MHIVFTYCKECSRSFWYEAARRNGGRKRTVCDTCKLARVRRQTRERVRRHRMTATKRTRFPTIETLDRIQRMCREMLRPLSVA